MPSALYRRVALARGAAGRFSRKIGARRSIGIGYVIVAGVVNVCEIIDPRRAM